MTGQDARMIVETAVRRELFGPEPGQSPVGDPLDCSAPSLELPSKLAARGPFHDHLTLEEVLTRTEPLKRYGIGVLHPGGSLTAASDQENFIPGLPVSEDNPELTEDKPRDVAASSQVDSDDFDLSDANRRQPSVLAVSFKVRVADDSRLEVQVSGAYYEKKTVHILDSKSQAWWVRRPFVLQGRLGNHEMSEDRRLRRVKMTPTDVALQTSSARMPVVTSFCRAVPGDPDPRVKLMTVAVVNDLPGAGSANAFFQVEMSARTTSGMRIEPYPGVDPSEGDDEESSIALLYRRQLTYAVGHGCAANWSPEVQESDGRPHVLSVTTDVLPAHEVPSLTPDVYERHEDGSRTPVTVSMNALASGSQEGTEQIERVLTLYSGWIDERRQAIGDLASIHRDAANRHMDDCQAALLRMQEGWKMVRENPLAGRAFRLANLAMLNQQLRSRLPVREIALGSDKIYRPQGLHPVLDPTPNSGRWRAFQIMFVLATLPELVDPDHTHRDQVDLIFFPTGGGKTEAYLCASAISLLARRLRDRTDSGTDTLMRYTLRLLTAQQFLRAASLVCVLEDIRSNLEEELGSEKFGIGVWLGGDSTPNTWKAADASLKQLHRDYSAPNQFLLLRCPWCGTRMGPIRKARGQDTPGYVRAAGRVLLRCVDDVCRFGGRSGLPVHVVDEDIYESRPSIVIGTVDKFATMAWQPNVRSIFGLDNTGERRYSPPGLIIQDELHLISGPLGSMVGLYEAIIDDLTTDSRDGGRRSAKIIAATATVRRYKEQIKGLFGRDRVALFPPHGLEEGHSFFAEPAVLEDGTVAPGRRYLGVMSPSLGSTQTVQVRVAAATLQAGQLIADPVDRDGYWTNVNFLNSLRELGNTLSLIDSDIPDYLVGLQRRDGVPPRYPRNTMELTSRRRSDEIPRAIEELQVRLPDPKCVDICLASSIIEVGIDIDRLGLMTIVGQPKTTSQYIQVSGRVGRSPQAPGLVIVIYGASKPRDRSHYERFRSYHQQLYGQVEPTSVTPFAEPVLKRALHAAAISWMRQKYPDLQPEPFPRAAYDEAILLLRRRAAAVDPRELLIFDYWKSLRAQQWRNGQRTMWSAMSYGAGSRKQGLMRQAGSLDDPEYKGLTWETPMSMRSVDAECRLEVTTSYLRNEMPTEGFES